MSIFPNGHSLEKILVTRKMINCDYLVEIQYYSSGKYPRVCYWCGLDRQFVLAPENLKSRFLEIYPLCQDCDTHKKKFFTKLPIKRKGVPGVPVVTPKRRSEQCILEHSFLHSLDPIHSFNNSVTSNITMVKWLWHNLDFRFFSQALNI